MPANGSIRRRLTLVALSLGVLQVLLFQISNDAPARLNEPPADYRAFSAFLKQGELGLAVVGGNGGVEARLQPIPAADVPDRHKATVQFFNAAYYLYPRLIYVGDGTAVVNSDAQLFAAGLATRRPRGVDAAVVLYRNREGDFFWAGR